MLYRSIFRRNPATTIEDVEYAAPLSTLYDIYQNNLIRLKHLVDSYPEYSFTFSQGPGSAERYNIFRDGEKIHSGWVTFDGAINQIAYDAYGEGYQYRKRWGGKRHNPYTLEDAETGALTFDPYQTGDYTFDPDEADTRMFYEETADDIAAEALAEALQNGMSWKELGKAVAESWKAPGMKYIMSRKLRDALLHNPKVQEAMQRLAAIWLEEANRMRRNPDDY
jgi:hypothetical protein